MHTYTCTVVARTSEASGSRRWVAAGGGRKLAASRVGDARVSIRGGRLQLCFSSAPLHTCSGEVCRLEVCRVEVG